MVMIVTANYSDLGTFFFIYFYLILFLTFFKAVLGAPLSKEILRGFEAQVVCPIVGRMKKEKRKKRKKEKKEKKEKERKERKEGKKGNTWNVSSSSKVISSSSDSLSSSKTGRLWCCPARSKLTFTTSSLIFFKYFIRFVAKMIIKIKLPINIKIIFLSKLIRQVRCNLVTKKTRKL